jgi:hypothetical protein
MNDIVLKVIVAVLLISTATLTVLQSVEKKSVNSNIDIVLDVASESTEEIKVEETDEILSSLGLEKDKTSTFEFTFLNRELPENWDGKNLYLKYIFLGNYEKEMADVVNQLLENEYGWKNQLDSNGDVLFNGPLLYKDNTYQLYVHNSLYLAKKYFLLGDVLHYLSNSKNLIGTEIMINDLTLEAIWEEDINVLEKSNVKEDADLIMSTCLERHGDRRLVVGWNVVKDL